MARSVTSVEHAAYPSRLTVSALTRSDTNVGGRLTRHFFNKTSESSAEVDCAFFLAAIENAWYLMSLQ